MPRFPTSYVSTIVLCGAIVTFSNGVYAETSSPSSQASTTMPPSSSVTLQTPRRGMRMEDVQRQHGVPSARLPAIGDPPITRWVYDQYTVYFENQYVIHSVANQ